MPNLEPRDHQLYADLERAFAKRSFLLKPGKWVDFELKSSLATLPGDEESIDRLVEATKIIDLGSINDSRHFALKKEK